MKLIQNNRPLMMDVFHPQFANRFFEGFINPSDLLLTDKSGFNPPSEMLHTGNAVKITLALPGLTKQDVKIELNGDAMVVSGERKRTVQVEENSRFYTEMAYGKFNRVFTLKEEINREEISAEFSDGLLKINLPLKEKQGSKAIEIK